ncbi:MAG: hypothetical protein WC536_01220 [Patescibacteria group bacterium]
MSIENNSGQAETFSSEKKSQPISMFNFDGVEEPVSFVETMQVIDGVECDIYSFTEDERKDLGIIRVEPGKKTPLQRVLQGEKTIEQYISGKGKLTITRQDGTQDVFLADGSNHVSRIVNIGEMMQWEAAPDSDLIAAEICYPPYQDGRFENIN